VLVTTSAELAREVGRLTAGWEQVRTEVVASLDEALARVDAYAPEHLGVGVASVLAQVEHATELVAGGSLELPAPRL